MHQENNQYLTKSKSVQTIASYCLFIASKRPTYADIHIKENLYFEFFVWINSDVLVEFNKLTTECNSLTV